MAEIFRKLAEIAKIESIKPIEGADKLELAAIRGWNIVVQKGLHKVGDLVVYFSIDSLLPELPEFEFLRKNCYVKASNSVYGAGFRLRTIKLRGITSQGLILSLNQLFDIVEIDSKNFISISKQTNCEDKYGTNLQD